MVTWSWSADNLIWQVSVDHNMTSFIHKVQGKPRLHVSASLLFGAWPPYCATPPSSPSPSSACATARNTANHDNHEKNQFMGFLYFLWVWGSACRPSAAGAPLLKKIIGNQHEVQCSWSVLRCPSYNSELVVIAPGVSYTGLFSYAVTGTQRVLYVSEDRSACPELIYSWHDLHIKSSVDLDRGRRQNDHKTFSYKEMLLNFVISSKHRNIETMFALLSGPKSPQDFNTKFI